MKIAAISGIKNEADVIESFIRLNAKYIDDFYFIDDSVDSTPEILRKLAEEGFNIIKVNADTRDYQNSKIMTSVTRFVNSKHQYDWIFYLDADEILYAPSRSAFEQVLNQHRQYGVGVIRHLEFAANNHDYFESRNPLKDCFNIRSVQSLTKKAFIRGDLFDKVIIGPGQHDAFGLDGKILEYFESGIQLGHFPVRRAQQYVARSIVVYTTLVAKLNKIPYEGNHQVRQYEWLKERGFQVGQEDVTNWGLRFGLDEATGQTCYLTEGRPDYLDDIACRYHDLWRSNDTMILALELERISNLLSDFRHKTYDALEAMRGLF